MMLKANWLAELNKSNTIPFAVVYKWKNWRDKNSLNTDNQMLEFTFL